jgi:hypothetical protein
VVESPAFGKRFPLAAGTDRATLLDIGMNDTENGQEWLEGQSPVDDWEPRVTQRVLDELFLI